MDSFLSAQLKLMPEMSELLQKRYRILQTIQLTRGIGRRVLGEQLDLTERETRKELDALRTKGLIEVSREGAAITAEGNEVLIDLKEVVRMWSGRSQMELMLKKYLNIKDVIIVPGNVDTDTNTSMLLSQEAAKYLESILLDEYIVAVTGGSTIASISHAMTESSRWKDLLFIAARGGVGKDVRLQANTIASLFASKMNGTYRTLYIPDRLSEEAYMTMKKEPFIQEMMDLYERTNIIIHGIGDALEMAKRRNSSDEEIELLTSRGAVSESFGYYFNNHGEAVHHIRTIGVQLNQLQHIEHLLAVAGGAKKANALISYFKQAPLQTVLVTDEGAANEMMKVIPKNI
ncbi:sugar-binding domain-containing protein [Psychrobacillus sp. FSL K6-4046]|uniref:sugar-binding transcriptional regulator n=1 Tax=Psychrobacillus sp. FSL K6-4046 TaxID=2921550 RepID=UPI0026310F73|nr:sugar-binding domain-containing protein [uncultured Psychrobacillus sp.]